jgi:hypothetical protein
MDRHNGSQAVERIFAVAKPILDGAVTPITEEISAKGGARSCMSECDMRA